MEAIECIKSRRSVRKFNGPADHETIKKIIDAAVYAPSWKNTQIVRYNIVEDRAKIDEIADTAVLDFTYNAGTLHYAPMLAVQTVVNGVSGYEPDGSYTTPKGGGWEMFDAGISAQTFCLAAHAYGVKTVIMGIFDDAKVKKILGIPENETVTAVISMGVSDVENQAPPRKSTDEILRFL